MKAAIRQAAAVAALGACLASIGAPTRALAARVVPTSAQVWVAGREIAFSHLGIAYGDPVAPVDDPGITSLLAAVAASSSWQAGTRFVAITRADGKLITFTLGSNAASVDGATAPMPFAPFSDGTRFYLPLIPLARALDLGVRGFRGGYVFVPQILAVSARAEARRTVITISGSAPLAWRSQFDARQAARTLTLSFPGFGTDAVGTRAIKSDAALAATVTQTGPRGYPTTSVAIALRSGVRFVARRVGAGVAVDVVLGRSDAALRSAPSPATPPAVRVVRATPGPAKPTVASSPIDTNANAPATPAAAGPAASAEPSSEPAVEPTDVPTAQPLGPEPVTSSSPSPASGSPTASPTNAPAQDQKITDVSVVETATGTRITLTLSGPVSFEWHRLGDPDDRYWLDIAHATLVGPAQTLASKLAFIKEVKLSQHLLVPEKVVRLSVTPTQAIDVRVGSIEGSPNQLGIEIENQPPAADAATAGIGSIGVAIANAAPPSSEPKPTQPDLIVIDPGHGGNDPGSLNPAYGLTESKLTLAISLRLANDLKRQGWRVTLTREGDYEVGDPSGPDKQELQARCDVANASGARLFVSIHINASVSSAPNGITTYYWRTADRTFAQAVQSQLVSAVGITDDGVKRESFYVIHHTVMHAILVETAYLSNPHDADLLRLSSFLEKIAAGIARGIGEYAGGPQTPVGQNRPSHVSSSQGS